MRGALRGWHSASAPLLAQKLGLAGDKSKDALVLSEQLMELALPSVTAQSPPLTTSSQGPCLQAQQERPPYFWEFPEPMLPCLPDS